MSREKGHVAYFNDNDFSKIKMRDPLIKKKFNYVS